MPCYVIDEAALVRNLEILKDVQERAGVKVLLASKAYSCAATYPLCAKYLAGTTSSSLFEARHAKEGFPGEVHIFTPAYLPEDMDAILATADHVIFNSLRQYAHYGVRAQAAGVSVGLRVNPEVSVSPVPMYDACRPDSRFGVTRAVLDAAGGLPPSVEGLHFHALCEQGVPELQKVLAGFEARFGDLIPKMKWVNLGGGHHITRADYAVDDLVALLLDFRARYPGVTVYLEPGEAVALDAGTLEARVLEVQPIGPDGISNVIVDVSAACHMPDVLEMPYTPSITGATIGTEGPYVYRFGGPTCLSGDIIGTYSFTHELTEGVRVSFENMAIYTMVKNNTFNGVNLPDIVLRHTDGREELLRRFTYEDFATRLA